MVKGYRWLSVFLVCGFLAVVQPQDVLAQGNALDFDGSNDYVSVSDATDPTAYTIEMWVKLDVTSDQLLLTRADGLTGASIGFFVYQGKFLHYTWTDQSTGHYIQHSTGPNVGVWYHLAGTGSNGGELRFYINGEEIGSAQSLSGKTLWTGGSGWQVGYTSGAYNFLDGTADEIRIWNTVRTQAQIQEFMYRGLNGTEAGLEIYYPFNQSSGTTVNDLHSTAQNGTISGATWVASTVPFKPYRGQALNLNGTSQYAVTDANIANVYNSVTFEAWIKPDVALGNGKWDRIAGTDFWAPGNNWLFSGKHELSNGLAVAMGNNPFTLATSSNVVKTGVWQHVAFTFDDVSNVVTIYHNGDSVATGSFTGTMSGGRPLGIGRNGNSGTEYFDGQMDEIRVWSVARTQTELRDNMIIRLTGAEAGLEAYYNFDATSGTKLIDLSLKGNHASGVSTADSNWVSSDFAYKGYVAQQTGFRMLAAPTSVSYATLLSNVWTQGATGGDVTNGSPNVWTWNNAGSGDVSSNWTAVPDLSATLASGQGFLYYHFNNDDFAGNNNYYSSDISVAGTEFSDPSITVNSTLDGWTLVGNPYFTPVSWTAMAKSNLYSDARVWDPVSASWKLTSAEPVIAPYQSFFVRTFAGSPTLGIDSGDKVYGGTFRAKESKMMELAITARTGNFRDEAMVRFYPEASTGDDMWDAVKTTPLSTGYLAIPLMDGDKAFAIRSFPVITGAVEIPLAVDFTQSGKVTLGVRLNALPDGWTAELLDTKTGSRIVLGSASESVYSFDHVFAGKLRESKDIVAAPIEMKAVSEKRFVLRITPANATSNEGGNLPSKLALEQNYPNPFNPSTTIRFALPQAGNVKLEVLNLLGQTVATVANGAFSAGNHAVGFDASKLASGVYLYRISAGGSVITKKMSLIK